MRPSAARVASTYLKAMKPGWLDATADTPTGALLTELDQQTAVVRLQEACRYAQQAEAEADRHLEGAIRVEDDMDRFKRAGTAAHTALLEAQRAIRGDFEGDTERVERVMDRIWQSLESLAAWGAHE